MHIDYFALFLILLVAPLTFLFRRYFFTPSRNTHLSYPSLSPLKARKPTFFERFHFIPKLLATLSLLSLALAFIDPHLLEEGGPSDSPPKEGLALYLVLDRSGSMQTAIDPPLTRFDVLKKASIAFIRKFPSDLIGAIAFARAAEVISPLTWDHRLLEKRISELQVIQDKEQDGTSMGYAIYKTAHLINAAKIFQQEENVPYKIQKAIMIVVTDGFQDPNLLDKGNRIRAMELDEAAKFAKEKGVKVFILNIDPSIQEKKFLPNLHELQRAAEETGGELVVVNQIADLEAILKRIPQEEKSKIYGQREEVLQKRISFYPYFIALGLFLMGLYIFSEEAVWRKSV